MLNILNGQLFLENHSKFYRYMFVFLFLSLSCAIKFLCLKFEDLRQSTVITWKIKDWHEIRVDLFNTKTEFDEHNIIVDGHNSFVISWTQFFVWFLNQQNIIKFNFSESMRHWALVLMLSSTGKMVLSKANNTFAFQRSQYSCL
jgi:hypothetical protein